MAITRTTSTTIATVEIDDDCAIELTLYVGREKFTRTLTIDEAEQYAAEITTVTAEARSYAAEEAAA